MVKKYFLLFYGALNFPFFAFFRFFRYFFFKNSRKIAKKYFHKSKITKIATNHLYSTIKLFLWHLKFFSSFHHHVFKRSYGQKTAKNAIFGQLSFFSKNHISKTVHLTEKVENTFYRQNIPNSRFLPSEKLYEDQKVLFWGSFLLLKKRPNPPERGPNKKSAFQNLFRISSRSR